MSLIDLFLLCVFSIIVRFGIWVFSDIVNTHEQNKALFPKKKTPSKEERTKLLKKEIRDLEKEKLEVEVDLLEAKTELLELTLPELRLVTQCMLCGHETKDEDRCEQCGASWLVNIKYASTSSTGT